MGIVGLLPLLKSVTHEVHVRKYRGQTVAIDGYCWIHRGVYACSQELCLGKDTDKYINYFMGRIKLLLNHEIKPYVVFDGGYLPAKASKEEERRSSREKNREQGLLYLASGRLEEARNCFVKATDVTPYMAYRIIEKLKKIGVQYVVAPYEADAQLAHLCKSKLVDAVISEDSDCIPYGCQNVLFKMDRDGNVSEIRRERLLQNKEINLRGFSDEMILDMCILAGCDYLSSIRGLSIKTAHQLVKRLGNSKRVIQHLRFEGKFKVPRDYEQRFHEAKMTFLHQRVYDPQSETLIYLTPLSEDGSLPSALHESHLYLGKKISDEEAHGIALGRLDPISGQPFHSSTLCTNPGTVPLRSAKRTLTLVNQWNEKENAALTSATAPVVVQSMDVAVVAMHCDSKAKTYTKSHENAFTRLMRRGRETSSSSSRTATKLGLKQKIEKNVNSCAHQAMTLKRKLHEHRLETSSNDSSEDTCKVTCISGEPYRGNVFQNFLFSRQAKQ